MLDAPAVLQALLRTEAPQVVGRWLFDPEQTLHAPHLLDVEVAQVLRRYSVSGEIDGDRGRMALLDLADLPVERYPHGFLLRRVWELRNNLTAYDAIYVALAEALDAPLLTRGRRLAAAAADYARIRQIRPYGRNRGVRFTFSKVTSQPRGIALP